MARSERPFGAAAVWRPWSILIKSDERVPCSAFLREYQELSEAYTVVSLINARREHGAFFNGVSAMCRTREVFHKDDPFQNRRRMFLLPNSGAKLRAGD